jgi:hypothetical protein
VGLGLQEQRPPAAAALEGVLAGVGGGDSEGEGEGQEGEEEEEEEVSMPSTRTSVAGGDDELEGEEEMDDSAAEDAAEAAAEELLLRQQEEALLAAATVAGVHFHPRVHPHLPAPEPQPAALPVEQPFATAWGMLKFALVSSQAAGRPDQLGDGPYWAAAVVSALLGQQHYAQLLDVTELILRKARHDELEAQHEALLPGEQQERRRRQRRGEKPPSKRFGAFVAEAQRAASISRLVQVRAGRLLVPPALAHGGRLAGA